MEMWRENSGPVSLGTSALLPEISAYPDSSSIGNGVDRAGLKLWLPGRLAQREKQYCWTEQGQHVHRG